MMVQLWCTVILMVLAPYAMVNADRSIPEGHAHKFLEPQEDIDALVHLEKAREKAQFSEISPRIFEDIVNEALHNLTQKYDPINIPLLPTINVNNTEYHVDISLTLADISLNGLNGLTVETIDPGLGLHAPRPKISATLPRLSIEADHYSSGGLIINLPFNGEGNLTIAFIKLEIVIGFELMSALNYCAKEGSSYVTLELGHLVVDFEGMDPGTDQGEVINTVLGSFGPDIIDYIETQIMTDPLHEKIDKAFIGAINTAVEGQLGLNC